MKVPYFVTTPIFYVNAVPHIGHLHSTLICDAFQRWRRLLNPALSSVVFATGTDEHGSKVEQAANLHEHDVSVYCNQISQDYRNCFQKFGINFTHFTKTSDDYHKETVSQIWKSMVKSDYIYKDKYSGWYCVPDETFLTDCQLKDQEIIDKVTGQKIVQKVSLESGHPVEWTVEDNYKFRLSRFRNQLIDWLLKCEAAIVPKKYYSLVLNELMNNDLNDISISRPKERVRWAIPVPDDDSQTIYVWLDALCNYLTVARRENMNIWPPDVQVIGKDILKFHAIYWPAFLSALNFQLPKRLFVHSHWLVNDCKMSKSKGNVVDPLTVGLDVTYEGLRYFLLREAVPHSDANYSETKMIRILNSELADSFGNLLSRCTGSVINRNSLYPQYHNDVMEEISSKCELDEFFEHLTTIADQITVHYENGDFHKAVDLVMALLHKTNSFFEYNKPWNLVKDPEKMTQLESVLHITMESLRVCAILLQPIIPKLAGTILDKLNVAHSDRFWINAKNLSWTSSDHVNVSRPLSNNDEILFKKILMNSNEKQSKNQKRINR